MRRSRLLWYLSLVLVLSLVPAAALAEGEGETKKTAEAKGQESETAKSGEEKTELPTVITNDFLKRYSKPEDSAPRPATPATPATAKPAAGAKPGAADTKTPAAPAKPGEEEMSPEEKAKRIAEIDTELARLDRRILALKNPLLRGGVPPTAEERQAEAGMNNIEMIQSTEKRIADLKEEKKELQQ
jgi:hypothetical protein